MAHQLGNGRIGTGLVVQKQAQPPPFEKADAEAVRMVVRQAAAFGKSGKRKRNIGRKVAIHSEKLAHNAFLLVNQPPLRAFVVLC